MGKGKGGLAGKKVPGMLLYKVKLINPSAHHASTEMVSLSLYLFGRGNGKNDFSFLSLALLSISNETFANQAKHCFAGLVNLPVYLEVSSKEPFKKKRFIKKLEQKTKSLIKNKWCP